MRTKGCCHFSDVLECLGRVIVLHVLDSLHFTAFEAESEPFVCTPAPWPSWCTAHVHKGCCQFSDVLECLGRVIVLHLLDSLRFIAFEAESEPFVCTPAPWPSWCIAHAHKRLLSIVWCIGVSWSSNCVTCVRFIAFYCTRGREWTFRVHPSALTLMMYRACAHKLLNKFWCIGAVGVWTLAKPAVPNARERHMLAKTIVFIARVRQQKFADWAKSMRKSIIQSPLIPRQLVVLTETCFKK